MAWAVQTKKLIGQTLLEKGILSEHECEEVLAFQRKTGEYFCTSAVELGFACPDDIFKILSSCLGLEYINALKDKIDIKALAEIPSKVALHYTCLPFRFEAEKLVVILPDPLDIHTVDDLRILLDRQIKPVLGYRGDIVEAIKKYYGMGADIIDDMASRQHLYQQADCRKALVEDLENAQDASIIKFVNQIFMQAIKERATDIHVEPFQDELRIRFRIDGFLYEIPIPEELRLFHQAIISRIKVMANLDIAERRLAQDGRIKIKIKDRELDLRVSVLPSCLGEAVQIRILSANSFLNIENLGLLPKDFIKIESLINKAHGIIFVTGPTGSGKSTTLYSCLSKKNLPDIKIITTEDPVEYQIKGITQIQIQPKIGLTFAACLRSILRHDPDIVMVGEVRDAETAEITIRAAMTGHLVFSTLHTNDAPSAPIRLIDMGIEPFLVASSLVGVIAQRLVRVICPHCKQQQSIASDIFKDANIDVNSDTVSIFSGKGCQQCRFTGFKGRTAIFEILIIDEELRRLILAKATSQQIREKAKEFGLSTLRQSGLEKVLQGITTLDEVMRVT